MIIGTLLVGFGLLALGWVTEIVGLLVSDSDVVSESDDGADYQVVILLKLTMNIGKSALDTCCGSSNICVGFLY